MARHYKSKSNGSVNHQRDRFSDNRRNDQDPQPRNMYRRPVSSAENYAGMPTGMRGGLEDDAMIREDHRAIANLPQEVMIKPYPMPGSYIREVLNDDISGVDAQMGYDDAQRKHNFYPKKV
jgi:hypothetical protein